MKRLCYRVELSISPYGFCAAKLQEYPEFSLFGSDFTDLINKVQVQVPEFLYMMACNQRAFKPPVSKDKLRPLGVGKMPYYCSVNVHDCEGPTIQQYVRLPEAMMERVEQIVTEHDHFKSKTHFLAWAASRAIDSLSTNFWEEYNDFYERHELATDISNICDPDGMGIDKLSSLELHQRHERSLNANDDSDQSTTHLFDPVSDQ